MNKKEFRGYIFDCDGTLVDSMPAHYAAWNEIMLNYGVQFTEKRFYELGGVSSDKIVAKLAEEAGIVLDADAVSQEKEALFLTKVHLVEPMSKVIQIVEEVRNNFPIAVATGSTREIAEIELKKIGVYSWFQVIVTSEDVKRGKPFPDIYLEAAKRIGVPAKECCAFEDTDLGLEAAEAAGMAVVDIRKI
ncbi:MAG: HAD family phosphatase [SAR324 cluster bacterium]|nr:HAD family phosphatase [SAR324 cluster bacterium]